MSSMTPGNDPQPTTAPPLLSTLAGDPDMAELVEFFVEDMGDRLEMITSATQHNDLGTLRTVAHQLKGAAAGYGFAPISDVAGSLEKLIDESGPAAEVENMREQVDELIDLCRRVSM